VSDVISWLGNFYASNCNGDWEHEFGIAIETLDNPGWSVSVDLERTELTGLSFERMEIERSQQDWVRCWIENGAWKGFGGPRNLQEILQVFRRWAESRVK